MSEQRQTPEQELVQALIEAAALLNVARPPEANPYSWVQAREEWMYRQRVRLMKDAP